MMSCFRCEVAENCALLGYYAASQFYSTVGPPIIFPTTMGQDISCLLYLSLPFLLFFFVIMQLPSSVLQ